MDACSEPHLDLLHEIENRCKGTMSVVHFTFNIDGKNDQEGGRVSGSVIDAPGMRRHVRQFTKSGRNIARSSWKGVAFFVH